MYGGMVRLVAQGGQTSGLLDFLQPDADVGRTVEPGMLRFAIWESPGESNVALLNDSHSDADAFETRGALEFFKHFVDEVVPSLREPHSFVVRFTNSSRSHAGVIRSIDRP